MAQSAFDSSIVAQVVYFVVKMEGVVQKSNGAEEVCGEKSQQVGNSVECPDEQETVAKRISVSGRQTNVSEAQRHD